MSASFRGRDIVSSDLKYSDFAVKKFNENGNGLLFSKIDLYTAYGFS